MLDASSSFTSKAPQAERSRDLVAECEDAILNVLAKGANDPEPGATQNYTIGNCLNFARRTISGFDHRIRGKTVLDYGCGSGWQAVAMHLHCGASRVHGIDVVERWFAQARRLAADHGCDGAVTFDRELPAGFEPDIVLSLSAFEHFDDPVGELRRMASLARPGGEILIAWAEPWYSHSGSHFSGYTRLPLVGARVPWLNLAFSERALLKLRSRFRPDDPPATRFAEVSGGLNQMTVARFERILRESGLDVRERRLFATRGLPLVTRVPILRELLTSAASSVIRVSRDANAG
jgi:SAM-dependent methyltransferase